MYENLQTRVLLFWEIYQLENMNEASPLMAGLHHRIILFFEPARSYFSVEILFARSKPYSLTYSALEVRIQNGGVLKVRGLYFPSFKYEPRYWL